MRRYLIDTAVQAYLDLRAPPQAQVAQLDPRARPRLHSRRHDPSRHRAGAGDTHAATSAGAQEAQLVQLAPLVQGPQPPPSLPSMLPDGVRRSQPR